MKWEIEHVPNSNGYIRIKSAKSNLFIGIDPSNTSLIKQYDDVTDYTLWKIERSTAGNLVFKCKATESSGVAMSVPLNNGANGADLVNIAYTSDTNYRDEWEIYRTPYTFTINYYYDQGYSVRFNSTGQDISEYHIVCSEVLLKLFGLSVTRTISGFTSAQDTCVGLPITLDKTKNVCADCDTRTDMMDSVVSQFGNGSETVSKIGWTGHILQNNTPCSFSGASHFIAMTVYGAVNLTTHENLTDNTAIKKNRTNTLLHEISHQLGTVDHYCKASPTSLCTNPHCWNCVYGYAKEPICIMSSQETRRKYGINDLENIILTENFGVVYCDQCKSSVHEYGILTHLNDHHN